MATATVGVYPARGSWWLEVQGQVSPLGFATRDAALEPARSRARALPATLVACDADGAVDLCEDYAAGDDRPAAEPPPS